MRDDLMPEKIEIDQMHVTPPFRATEQAAVKGPGGLEVVNGEGEVEGRQRHAGFSRRRARQSKARCRKNFPTAALSWFRRAKQNGRRGMAKGDGEDHWLEPRSRPGVQRG